MNAWVLCVNGSLAPSLTPTAHCCEHEPLQHWHRYQCVRDEALCLFTPNIQNRPTFNGPGVPSRCRLKLILMVCHNTNLILTIIILTSTQLIPKPNRKQKHNVSDFLHGTVGFFFFFFLLHFFFLIGMHQNTGGLCKSVLPIINKVGMNVP